MRLFLSVFALIFSCTLFSQESIMFDRVHDRLDQVELRLHQGGDEIRVGATQVIIGSVATIAASGWLVYNNTKNNSKGFGKDVGDIIGISAGVFAIGITINGYNDIRKGGRTLSRVEPKERGR